MFFPIQDFPGPVTRESVAKPFVLEIELFDNIAAQGFCNQTLMHERS